MLLLIDLPKPIHGLSNVNKAMMEYLKTQALKVNVINTSPSYANRLFNTKIWFFIKAFHSIYCYFILFIKLLTKPDKLVYRSINGGIGQVFDLGYVFLCKIFNKKVYVHHHSFNYLNKKSVLFSILNKLLGKSAIHIALGEKMKERLIDVYGINPKNIQVLSNLTFFNIELNNRTQNDSKCITVGHLANLCVEKGLDIFLQVCRNLAAQGVNYQAKLAGPFADGLSEKLVYEAINEIPNIEYIGPIYGDNKSRFYRAIDCFIFPSKYLNEAEPLVLYESAQFGSLLIGTKRGCMADVLSSLQGHSIDESVYAADEITSIITDEIQNKCFSVEQRIYRTKIFNELYINSQEVLKSLTLEFIKNDLSRTK